MPAPSRPMAASLKTTAVTPARSAAVAATMPPCEPLTATRRRPAGVATVMLSRRTGPSSSGASEPAAAGTVLTLFTVSIDLQRAQRRDRYPVIGISDHHGPPPAAL